ncbi:hypothetical protein ACIBCT_35755 [Streptosporangium sp. NPDC050855]|uniref:hypothetical protein n=1 Tax=Streptosporangium sp. NPDC050855 TaxID=3366194 RepID=UPI0037A48BD2
MSADVLAANTRRVRDGREFRGKTCLIWTGSADSKGAPRYWDSSVYEEGARNSGHINVRRWVVAQVCDLADDEVAVVMCGNSLCLERDHLQRLTKAQAANRRNVKRRKEYAAEEIVEAIRAIIPPNYTENAGDIMKIHEILWGTPHPDKENQ